MAVESETQKREFQRWSRLHPACRGRRPRSVRSHHDCNRHTRTWTGSTVRSACSRTARDGLEHQQAHRLRSLKLSQHWRMMAQAYEPSQFTSVVVGWLYWPTTCCISSTSATPRFRPDSGRYRVTPICRRIRIRRNRELLHEPWRKPRKCGPRGGRARILHDFRRTAMRNLVRAPCRSAWRCS